MTLNASQTSFTVAVMLSFFGRDVSNIILKALRHDNISVTSINIQDPSPGNNYPEGIHRETCMFRIK